MNSIFASSLNDEARHDAVPVDVLRCDVVSFHDVSKILWESELARLSLVEVSGTRALFAESREFTPLLGT